MKYLDLKQALENVFQYNGFNTVFGINKTYEDFENDKALSKNSICISYDGMIPSGDLENFNYTMTENVTVYIKYFGKFEDFRNIYTDIIQNARVQFIVDNIQYYLSFEGFNIEDVNEYFVVSLNYGVTGLW